ncbi:MAG: hypothetical protein AAGJ11_05840 [Bacteroidota bacterium]
MTGSQARRLARAEAVAVAQAVLLNRLGVLEAACRLSSLRHDGDAENDGDFLVMAAAWDDTDGLPVGPEREHWHPDVLPQKNEEIAAVTAHWEPAVRESCRRIVDRYGPEVWR